MTDDTGFAPNPFHGVLTLATCKPQIRLKKSIGDHIAGFTSKRLCGDKVGEERLVFIMKITEKLNYSDYFSDDRYQIKIPNNLNIISKVGDNIYKPSNENEMGFIQLSTVYHNEKNDIEHDLTGKNVLLSNDFFYFGRGAIPIYRSKFNINIPKGQSGHGVKSNDTEVRKLWQHLKDNYQSNIAINPPLTWKENEPFN